MPARPSLPIRASWTPRAGQVEAERRLEQFVDLSLVRSVVKVGALVVEVKYHAKGFEASVETGR